jgi:hypothetical protein
MSSGIMVDFRCAVVNGIFDRATLPARACRSPDGASVRFDPHTLRKVPATAYPCAGTRWHKRAPRIAAFARGKGPRAAAGALLRMQRGTRNSIAEASDHLAYRILSRLFSWNQLFHEYKKIASEIVPQKQGALYCWGLKSVLSEIDRVK